MQTAPAGDFELFNPALGMGVATDRIATIRARARRVVIDVKFTRARALDLLSRNKIDSNHHIDRTHCSVGTGGRQDQCGTGTHKPPRLSKSVRFFSLFLVRVREQNQCGRAKGKKKTASHSVAAHLNPANPQNLDTRQ